MFWILHIVAVFTFPVALFVTIPLHIIDLESEGGTQGVFGILPVAFCPTCYAGCVDMVQQFEEIE